MAVSPEVAEYIAKHGKPVVDNSLTGFEQPTGVSPEIQEYINQNKPQELTQEQRRKQMNLPEKIGAYTLRGGQFLGGMAPAGWSIPITAGTESLIGKLEHQTPEEIAKNTAMATGIDAAVTLGTAGLPIIGGIAKPFFKGGAKAGTKAIAKGLAKEGEEQLVKEGIETLAKQAPKPTVSHGLASIVGNLGERDVKRIVRDRVPIGSGANLDKLYGNAANKIERLVSGKKDLVNNIYRKALEEKGIPQTALVDSTGINTTIKDIMKEFKAKDIAGMGKETSMALSNVKKAIGNKKQLTLDQIKNVKSALHEISQKAYDEGVGNKFTSLAKRAEGAAIQAENSIPGMKELNKEYSTTIKAINKLQNITKTRLAEGEIVTGRAPLAGRLMKLKKEDVYGKELGKLQAIDKIIGKKLGPEYKFMDDVDSALITDKLTKGGKAGLEATGFGATPKGLAKQASNLAFLSPVMKARLLSKFGGALPKGTLSKEIGGIFPRLSTIQTLTPYGLKKGLVKAPIQEYERKTRE